MGEEAVKVILADGRGSFIVRVDEGDVPPGMEQVRIVETSGGVSPMRVSPARKLGSVLAMMDPDEWVPFQGPPPSGVLEAAAGSRG